MYDTRGALPVGSLPPGTRLLCLSPPLAGGRTVAHRLIASGLDRGEAAVIVSTDRGPDSVRSDVAKHVDASTADGALDRLAVVSCTEAGGRTDDPLVEHVTSPSDLTGIGIAFSSLLDRLDTGAAAGLRIVVDSLSSLLVYSGVERVFRFAHAFAGRLADIDAIGLFLLQPGPNAEQVGTFEGLFDGVLECHETQTGSGTDGSGPIREYRLRGVPDAPADWQPIDPAAGPAARETADRDSGHGSDTEPDSAPNLDSDPDSDGGGDDDAATVPRSLRALIDSVDAAALTLTVYNPTVDTDGLAAVTDHFERQNVAVRTVELPTDTPRDAALLHRGSEPLAVSRLARLDAAIRVADAEPPSPDPDAGARLGFEADESPLIGPDRPAVLAWLDRLDRNEYTVSNGGKRDLVRISRLIEARALAAGTGRLHAGFQRLSRMDDEIGTRRLYERIATAGVDTHLYGRPGTVPDPEPFRIHADETPELGDSWFVVYDRDGDRTDVAALVTEETGPERYSGFWTYRPDLVRAADGYLRAAYW